MSGKLYKRNGSKWVHREVWEQYNGPIPPSYHIHHKDGDRDNNDISNLECLSPGDHVSLHLKLRPTLNKVCKHCDARYSTKSSKSMFCSKNCKSAHRRYSGIDDVSFTCPVCSSTITRSKYAVAETCGYVCGAVLIVERRTKA